MAFAIFAGGCFWCLEPPLRELDGVFDAQVGYIGGSEETATYDRVSDGNTGHFEAIRVEYDPKRTSYDDLLETFWRQIDPFDAEGQFADKGPQYRTAVFYGNDEERRAAEESERRVAEAFGRPVATLILPAEQFYPAEDYHQRYAEKNPLRYKTYKTLSGRVATTKELWGDKP